MKVRTLIESFGSSTTDGHVGDGSLVLGVLAGLLVGHRFGSGFGSPGDTGDDVGHGTGASRTEDLDGDDVGALGDTVLGGGDRAGDVRTVTVEILVGVLGDGFTPLGATLELDVVDVDSGVDNVGVDAFSGDGVVIVAIVSSEGERLAVRDSSESLAQRRR